MTDIRINLDTDFTAEAAARTVDEARAQARAFLRVAEGIRNTIGAAQSSVLPDDDVLTTVANLSRDLAAANKDAAESRRFAERYEAAANKFRARVEVLESEIEGLREKFSAKRLRDFQRLTEHEQKEREVRAERVRINAAIIDIADQLGIAVEDRSLLDILADIKEAV